MANLRGDTPLKMLQINTGSIWIGQKVMERICEENQANQRRNFLVKLTLDKVSLLLHAINTSSIMENNFFCYIAACPMVQHGGDAIPNILRSRSDI